MTSVRCPLFWTTLYSRHTYVIDSTIEAKTHIILQKLMLTPILTVVIVYKVISTTVMRTGVKVDFCHLARLWMNNRGRFFD